MTLPPTAKCEESSTVKNFLSQHCLGGNSVTLTVVPSLGEQGPFLSLFFCRNKFFNGLWLDVG